MKHVPLSKCPYRTLDLTKGFVAIVDKSTWSIIKKYKWYAHISKGKGRDAGKPYARTNIDGKKVYLHRLLTNCPPGLYPDHKNHQTIDCRLENLEVVTHLENCKRRRYCQRKKKAKVINATN